MQRYSKKREAILECLRSTDIHPTAEWIYERLKPDYPALSFATVYRNLGQLTEAGLVRSFGVVNGHERYDGRLEPHSHLVCSACGRVADLPSLSVSPEIIEAAENAMGFQISDAAIRFVGLCPACRAPKQ